VKLKKIEDDKAPIHGCVMLMHVLSRVSDSERDTKARKLTFLLSVTYFLNYLFYPQLNY